VKRLAIGLACCLAGILLYAVNWLGAAINVAQVTEWDTRYGRLHSAYARRSSPTHLRRRTTCGRSGARGLVGRAAQARPHRLRSGVSALVPNKRIKLTRHSVAAKIEPRRSQPIRGALGHMNAGPQAGA
jgi:hypothetical protein